MLLVDSGTSYNFMLSALAKLLGWRITPAAMHVCLANGEKLRSLGQVSGLVTCRKWHAGVSFIVLDLAFDVLFGLLWLVAANPQLDWAWRTLSVKHNCRWISPPTVASEKIFAGPF